MTKATLAVFGTLLLCGATLSAARAQQDNPFPPPQGGQFPQGRPFPGGGQFGGGRGGQFPGGGGNFALGTVTSVDANAGTVTITGRGGQPQTVKVTPATTIQSQVTGTLADLKVGDMVRVSGVPTAITATQIAAQPPAGEAAPPPAAPGGGGGFPGGGQFGGGGFPGGQGGFGGGRGPGGGGQSTVTAKVATLSPLTLKMTDGTTIAVTADSKTKITRIVSAPLSSLKAGDQIVGTGQTDDSGAFTASALNVNMGGGFGGGRFGQGGGQFGQGGFGGGQGANGRRRRGGQGGFGGGGFPGGGPQGGPPPPDNGVGAGGGNMDTLLNGE